jgi:hypothetical protein
MEQTQTEYVECSLDALLDEGYDVASDRMRRDPHFLVPDEDDE